MFDVCITGDMAHVNMLTRVWQQLEYHIDVCRVTRDAHIKHL